MNVKPREQHSINPKAAKFSSSFNKTYKKNQATSSKNAAGKVQEVQILGNSHTYIYSSHLDLMAKLLATVFLLAAVMPISSHFKAVSCTIWS